MKANEFILEEILDEYGKIDDGIETALRDKGYQLLGVGTDQMAFLEPGTGQVLKIFGTDSSTAGSGGARISSGHRMFEAWADYCAQNSTNPLLPKFSGFKRFVFNDHTYYQIRQEHLQPIEENLGYLLHDLSSTVTTFPGENFRFIVNQLQNDAAYGKPCTYDDMIARLGKDVTDKMIYTVIELNNIADRSGFNLDLHNENYMARGKTPVILDPWLAK